MTLLPCLAEAGIHSVVNGPVACTPDGLPGRAHSERGAMPVARRPARRSRRGRRPCVAACAFSLPTARRATIPWSLDPRRFTRYANVEYTALKSIEDYRNEFRFHMPTRFVRRGPAKTTPLYDRLSELSAHWGTVNGWERAQSSTVAGFHRNAVLPLRRNPRGRRRRGGRRPKTVSASWKCPASTVLPSTVRLGRRAGLLAPKRSSAPACRARPSGRADLSARRQGMVKAEATLANVSEREPSGSAPPAARVP